MIKNLKESIYCKPLKDISSYNNSNIINDNIFMSYISIKLASYTNSKILNPRITYTISTTYYNSLFWFTVDDGFLMNHQTLTSYYQWDKKRRSPFNMYNKEKIKPIKEL